MYQVLPSFTEFYRVLASFSEFYGGLPSFIWIFQVLTSFTEFYRVFTEFQWSSSSFTGFSLFLRPTRSSAVSFLFVFFSLSAGLIELWSNFDRTLIDFNQGRRFPRFHYGSLQVPSILKLFAKTPPSFRLDDRFNSNHFLGPFDWKRSTNCFPTYGMNETCLKMSSIKKDATAFCRGRELQRKPNQTR